MKTSIRLTVTTLIILLGASAFASDMPDNYVSLWSSIDFKMHNNMVVLSYADEKIRDVPSHDDDKWFTHDDERVFPIDNVHLDQGNFSSHWQMGIGLAKKVAEKNGASHYIKCGLFGKLVLFSDWGIKRRNYGLGGREGSEDRVLGAALTYYGFQDDITDMEKVYDYGIYIEYAREEKKKYSEDSRFYIRYEFELYDVSLQNGWDRYGTLETRQEHEIFDGVKHTIKFGWNSENLVECFVGYTHLDKIDITEMGDRCKFEVNHDIFFVGIAIASEWKLWK